MSLDGAFLHIVKTELISENLIGSRIDKIHQPSRQEVIISLRSMGGTKKLLLSANSVAARINLTNKAPENPPTPPMFCTILRKHLGGGRIIDIRQDGLERILNIDIEAMSEIGDMVINTLVMEIMGRHSNIILLQGGRVIDSIKRITDDVSTVRRILPNVEYSLPPRQERLNIFTCTGEQILEKLETSFDLKLSKALISILEGISPIVAREWAFYSARDVDVRISQLDSHMKDRLIFFLSQLKKSLNGGNFTVVKELSGKKKDFSFIPITQYSTGMLVERETSANKLLDMFFSGNDEEERLKQRSNDLLKLLMNTHQRIARKLEFQRQELEETKNRDVFRVYGDLINSHLHLMKRGESSALLDNFYTGEKVEIKLDTRLSPSQNAQKYYHEYRKLDTAEKKLTTLIAQGEEELIYIDSVFDAVSRTQGERELLEIRGELVEGGYLRHNRKTSKLLKPLPPMRFISSDGMEILAGRNNKQNDLLTLKTARGDDIWLHTQNIAGSHVIIRCHGETPSPTTLEEAAKIAAYCSKARESSQVPVDYTQVRYVKKPTGGKPGMVIFTHNKTLFVTPDEGLFNKLLIHKGS